MRSVALGVGIALCLLLSAAPAPAGEGGSAKAAAPASGSNVGKDGIRRDPAGVRGLSPFQETLARTPF